MVQFAQFGIAVGVLGIVLTFMGLFPGVTGVEPTPGIGFVQIILVLTGFGLLISGAFIYAKFTFYARWRANLAQQIGIRLAMTGLMFGAMAGLADILGFGSNIRTPQTDIYFGPWQAIGLLGGFLLASIGVLIYAVTGRVDDNDPS